MQANIDNNTNATRSQTSSGSSADHNRVAFNVSWKRDRVFSITPEAPLWEAAQMMKDHQIGDVVVMERAGGQSRPLGMITDRDIALCLSERVNMMNLKVMDVMTRSIVTASIHDDIFRLIHTMKEAGITRLPLMDEAGNIAGVVTAKNILEILVNCFFDVTQISEQQKQNELNHQH